ncbi:MAG: hypothetical protein JWR02_1113 [Mucilaginibacter sp.]|nr:hypothetical protein [Mucilaginibacter sp.]
MRRPASRFMSLYSRYLIIYQFVSCLPGNSYPPGLLPFFLNANQKFELTGCGRALIVFYIKMQKGVVRLHLI